MASFVKPPDMPLPSEIIHATEKLLGIPHRDRPLVNVLDLWSTVNNIIFEW